MRTKINDIKSGYCVNCGKNKMIEDSVTIWKCNCGEWNIRELGAKRNGR